MYQCFDVELRDQFQLVALNDSCMGRVPYDKCHPMFDEFDRFVEETEPTRVVIDFTLATVCPSAPIGSLVYLNRRLKEAGGTLVLCCMNSAVEEQFTRLNLDAVFTIRDTVSAAEAVFRSGP
ncbi:MAG: STAS domain-containing protein [Planctomycetaceae bacterium]|nr:STAS domain-containing protein [Planctomycetaceae bacterium]